MIMNNETGKLSRKRTSRIERRIKMDDKMISLINKIKSEKKNKNTDKIKQLEIELGKIKYANNPNKLQSEVKELNRILVIDKDLHEIKQEIFVDCAGEFEMTGKLKIGDQFRETHTRFRNISDYEAYINSIDEGYDAEDAIFNGYIYEINTRQFKLVNRSQYGNGCDFKHEFIEYRGKKLFYTNKRILFH